MKSIDRHILQRELAAFAAVLLLVTTILSLENVPRIWDAVSRTSAPFWLLQRMVLALLPEYLAVGLLVASFLAPVWVIRTMAMRGEWQMLQAMGMGPWRIMLAPLALAAVAAGGQLTLRLALEPYGERVLDALGTKLDSGAFGMPIRMQEFVRLDAGTTIYLMPPTRRDRHFGNVFMRRDGEIFSATSANAHRDAAGRIEVDLFDGRRIGRDTDGRDQVLDFSIFRFTFSPSVAAETILPASERLSRMPADALLGEAAHETAARTAYRPVTASLLARIGNALFCLLLPWLAYVLGQPAQRERSGAGILLGVGALVLFLRTSSLVEGHFTQWPIVAAAVHMSLWTGAIVGLVRLHAHHGAGFVDHAANGAIAGIARAWPRRPRLRSRLPVQATRRAPAAMPA